MIRILLLSAFFLACPLLAAETLTPAAWQERLNRLDRALASGDTADSTAQAGQLRKQQVAWPAGAGSADPGLQDAIARGDTAGARRRIAALRSAAPTPMAPTAVDRERLARLDRDRRSRTLAAGGSVGSMPDLDVPELDFLARVRARIGAWLESLGDWLRGLFRRSASTDEGLGGAVWGWIAAGLAVALLSAIVVAALRRRTPVQATAPILRTSGADAALDQPADDWLDEGSRLLAAGDHRAAVRAWYLGLLAATWERGLIHHRTGWTNWDYLRALPRTWAGVGDFRDLTGRFDLAWYGGRSDPASADSFGTAVRDLVKILRAGARP